MLKKIVLLAGRPCVLRGLLPAPISGEKKISKISEIGKSGVWDSLGGFRWNLRKMEMKPTFMPRSCHEFGQGVSLAKLAWPASLKIFLSPLKKKRKGKENRDRSHSAALNSTLNLPFKSLPFDCPRFFLHFLRWDVYSKEGDLLEGNTDQVSSRIARMVRNKVPAV